MNYPYSTATGTIPTILAKIQTVGQPSKLDKNWMASIGFKKTSEQRMIAILKFLGFAEKDGVPTEKWLKFRSNKTGKKVLGQAIKSAYSELYQTYPNAHELAKEELNHFFTTQTTAGSLALSHTVNTFRNLSGYAEFEEVSEEEESPSVVKKESKKESKSETTLQGNSADFGTQLSKQFQESKNGLTINLNIQLTVPETTDEKVYDKFFESLKKHLLT